MSGHNEGGGQFLPSTTAAIHKPWPQLRAHTAACTARCNAVPQLCRPIHSSCSFALLETTITKSLPLYDDTPRIFLPRQHVNACRVRYCYGKSVRPSVRHTVVLYRNECTYRQNHFHHLIGELLFVALPPLQKTKGNSLSGSVKYTRVGKICDFWDRSVSVSMTLSYLERWDASVQIFWQISIITT